MSDIMSKLNVIKPTKTAKSKGESTTESKINSLFQDACKKAIKEHPELSKYYVENLPKSDVWKQVKDDELEVTSISGQVIAIPTSNVKLVNGSKSHLLKEAFKVGTINTYLGGIKKQIVEFVPSSK